MGIKREEMSLSRLVDILDFKAKVYDKQISELEKREEIDRLFSKYPEEPIKALIELDSDEIISLISYFSDETIDESEVNIKKYWLEEAIYNENLRESIRYRDALRLFESLGDNLQEYYKELSYIDKSMNDLKELKRLNKSLSKALKGNKPIGDLIEYLPLFEVSKFLTHDDICDILSAISIYNLNLLKTKDVGYVETKDAIERQTTNLLTDVLKKEIDSYKEPDIIPVASNKIEKIDNIMKSILEDSENIIDFYPVELGEVLIDIWDEDLIEDELEKLSIPITVLKGKKQGLNIELNKEDKKILDNFVDKISKSLAQVKNEEELKEKEIIDKNNRDINKLKLLLNKVNKKDNIYFEPNDFELVIKLLNSKKIYKETIKNIIITMNSMNINLSNSKYKKPKDIIIESKKEEKEVEQPKKKNENLVQKYGYTFNSLPRKLVSILNKELQNKVDLLELMETNEDLKFIKDYCNIDTKNKLNKKIYDVKSGQVYYLLMYSNKEILENLLKISKENNFDIKDIFSIPKVYGSVSIDGTYENFVYNINYMNKNYKDLLPYIIKTTPYTLGVNNQLLIRNIELSKLYGLSLDKNKINTKPSFRALGIKDYSYIIDRYIEINEYDYIDRFRYQIDSNYSIALRIKYLQAKGIDNKLDGYVDIDSKFSKDIVKEGNDDSLAYLELSKGSNDIKWLDSINEEKDKNMKDIQYIIKGIYISRPKVLITLGNLIKDNSDNIKEKLLYSLVKDSYLKEEEFNTLKEVIYSRED